MGRCRSFSGHFRRGDRDSPSEAGHRREGAPSEKGGVFGLDRIRTSTNEKVTTTLLVIKRAQAKAPKGGHIRQGSRGGGDGIGRVRQSAVTTKPGKGAVVRNLFELLQGKRECGRGGWQNRGRGAGVGYRSLPETQKSGHGRIVCDHFDLSGGQDGVSGCDSIHFRDSNIGVKGRIGWHGGEDVKSNGRGGRVRRRTDSGGHAI